MNEYAIGLDDKAYRVFTEERLLVLAKCCDKLRQGLDELSCLVPEPANTRDYKRLHAMRLSLGNVSDLLQSRFLGD